MESIISHFSGLYTPYKKPPHIFCDVQRGKTTRHITLTSLSRRQQSSSTIESRDTRPRRMQEVNSLCTDNRAPRKSFDILALYKSDYYYYYYLNRILYCGHSKQYSHLVIFCLTTYRNSCLSFKWELESISRSGTMFNIIVRITRNRKHRRAAAKPAACARNP